jgi:hypothetical protein
MARTVGSLQMERQSTAPVFAISGASSMISLKFGNRNNMHESLLLLLLEMLTLVDIRCMEHSLHLSYRHFIEAVAPPPPFKFTGVAIHGQEMAPDDGDDDDSDAEFDVSDALRKALVLVKQVTIAPHSHLPH